MRISLVIFLKIKLDEVIFLTKKTRDIFWKQFYLVSTVFGRWVHNLTTKCVLISKHWTSHGV